MLITFRSTSFLYVLQISVSLCASVCFCVLLNEYDDDDDYYAYKGQVPITDDEDEDDDVTTVAQNVFGYSCSNK